MRRREFVKLLGGSAVTWPLAARARQASGMRRIGVLMGTPSENAESKAELAAFRDSLAKLGWLESNTIHIDYRFVADPDHYPSLAKELIALHPDVIFAQSTPVAAALQRETRAIAIVFVNVSDPIFADTEPRSSNVWHICPHAVEVACGFGECVRLGQAYSVLLFADPSQ